MNTLQFSITIYIHPDKGPVSNMQLDMLAIDTEVMRSPVGVDNNDARLDLIAKQITREFPNVEPQRKLNELRSLIARLSQLSLFDGVVLRLPGTIEGDASPQQQVPPTIEEIQRLTRQAHDLMVQLKDRDNKLNADKILIDKWEKDKKEYEDRNKGLSKQVEDLNEEVSEKDAQLLADGIKLTRIREIAKKYKGRAEQLEQERVQLQTEIESAKRDRQEMASLRQNLASMNKEVLQLQETLEKRDQDLKKCNERFRRLTEQGKRGANPNKEPWMP